MGDNENTEEPQWAIGQRIQVTCRRSKHYGRYGSITHVHRTRLGVKFEDPRPGSFINMSRARIVDEEPPPAAARMVVEPDDGEEEVTELSWLLEHMVFTAATLISSNGDDPARVERTLAEFSTTVRNNTRIITQQRQDHTLPLN
jgi:hypothetical protein